MSNLIDYAKAELAEAKLFSKDGEFYGGMVGMAVMELIECFSKQGHSGMSAGIVRQLFNKLSNFEPINELKFEDENWVEYGDGKYQHKKLCSLFKDGKNGKPSYSDAIIWEDEDGCCFTGSREGISSSQYIRIPFVPKKFYVRVNDKYDKIIDRAELDRALAYYDGQQA